MAFEFRPVDEIHANIADEINAGEELIKELEKGKKAVQDGEITIADFIRDSAPIAERAVLFLNRATGQ